MTDSSVTMKRCNRSSSGTRNNSHTATAMGWLLMVGVLLFTSFTPSPKPSCSPSSSGKRTATATTTTTPSSFPIRAFLPRFSLAAALNERDSETNGEVARTAGRLAEDDGEEDDDDEFEYSDVPSRASSRRQQAWRTVDERQPKDQASSRKGFKKAEEDQHFLLLALRLKVLFEGRWVDVVAVALIVLVVVTAYIGKRENYELARTWMRVCRPVLEQQFSSIGFPGGDSVLPKSWSCFEFYATGRKNCRFLSVEMECAKRQCFWRWHCLNFLAKQEAVIRFEISTETLDTVVFGVCRKREQKQFLGEHCDLRTLSRPRERKDLPGSLLCCSDTTEAASMLLRPQIVKALSEVEFLFTSIIVSDLSAPQRCPKRPGIVRLDFKLPEGKQMELVAPEMLLMALWITDLATEMKIGEKTRDALLKLRRAPTENDRKEEEDSRNEAMEKRRQEKRRQEEERLERATPEQRRKLEEKLYKKQLKQTNPRYKLLKA